MLIPMETKCHIRTFLFLSTSSVSPFNRRFQRLLGILSMDIEYLFHWNSKPVLSFSRIYLPSQWWEKNLGVQRRARDNRRRLFRFPYWMVRQGNLFWFHDAHLIDRRHIHLLWAASNRIPSDKQQNTFAAHRFVLMSAFGKFSSHFYREKPSHLLISLSARLMQIAHTANTSDDSQCKCYPLDIALTNTCSVWQTAKHYYVFSTSAEITMIENAFSIYSMPNKLKTDASIKREQPHAPHTLRDRSVECMECFHNYLIWFCSLSQCFKMICEQVFGFNWNISYFHCVWQLIFFVHFCTDHWRTLHQIDRVGNYRFSIWNLNWKLLGKWNIYALVLIWHTGVYTHQPLLLLSS